MKTSQIILALPLILLISCAATKKPKTSTPVQQSHTISLALTKMPQSNIYINMDYGIRLNVSDKRASTATLNKYEGNINTLRPRINTYPDVQSFVSESMRSYMQTMGFSLDADINTDYMLQADITQFQVSYLSGTGWVGTVFLDVQIYDSNRTQVIPAQQLQADTHSTAHYLHPPHKS